MAALGGGAATPIIQSWISGRNGKRPVKSSDFESFKESNEQTHREIRDEARSHQSQLGGVIQAACIDVSNAASEMRSGMEKLGEKVDEAARDQRKALAAFEVGVDTTLGEVHKKVNGAIIEVATLKGRFDALEPRK
jgi:hypothetical protein